MNKPLTFLLTILAAAVAPITNQAAPHNKQTIGVVDGKPMAPAFQLHDLQDKQHALADYRGKVVAVNFWATWCPPCRKELPSMQRAYHEYKDKGFIILGVNEGEDWDTVAPFLENFSLNYPILLDKASTVIGDWKVMGLPTTFIIDREGHITHRINGGRDWDDPDFRKSLKAVIESDS